MRQYEHGFSYAFILLLGTVSLGLVAGFIYFRPRPAEPAATTMPPASSRESVHAPSSPLPSMTPAITYTIANGLQRQEKDFSFTYPKDWTITEEMLESGKAYRMYPASLRNGLGYPKLIVEQTKGSSSLITRQQTYIRQGYKERVVQVATEHALLYATQSAMRVTDKSVSNEPIQVAIVPLQHADTFYTIIYEYEGGASPEKDTLLTDFLGQFQFVPKTTLLN